MKQKCAELWAMLMMDRKRAGILGLLCMVLLVSVGRMAFKGGPSRAVARDGQSSVASIPGMDGAFAAVTAEDLRKSGPTIRVERPAPISRNLFTYSRSYFPEPPQKESTTQVKPKSPVRTDDNTEDDARLAYERLMEQVRTELRSLRLRSTMLGARPVAVIERRGSGSKMTPEVIRPGEMIAGFEVVQVRAHSVLLTKDGIMVELQREMPER